MFIFQAKAFEIILFIIVKKYIFHVMLNI